MSMDDYGGAHPYGVAKGGKGHVIFYCYYTRKYIFFRKLMASTNWIYFPANAINRSYVQGIPSHRAGRIDYLLGPILIRTSMRYLKTSFFLDYEQFLLFFRFGKGSARAPSVERRSRETRETRAARKSWILDSASFVTGTWILDSNRNRDSRFLGLNSGFQSLGFRIWRAKISVFRNLDCLKGGDFSN